MTALTLLLVAQAATAAADEPLPAGLVLTLGEVDGEAALRGAHAAGGARWSNRSLSPAPATEAEAPAALVQRLRSLYVEGDNLACLAAMQAPALSPDALLRGGHRESASMITILGAACAMGGGDTQLAERLLGRAFLADLDTEPLSLTRPEVQQLAERMQREVTARERVSVMVRSRPAGASVRLDGIEQECRTPCELSLRPGAHEVVLERLGSLPRGLTLEVERSDERTVALDPAPAAVLQTQLEAYLAKAREPDRVEIAQVAAQAYAARVVVVAWRQGGRTVTAIWDRGLRRVVARASANADAEGARTATQNVVNEWRGIVEPTPLLAQPAFWLITAAVVAGAVTATLFLTREPEKNFVLEVR